MAINYNIFVHRSPAIWGYPDDFSKKALRKSKIKRIFNVNKYSR